jgi:hypothetical protein
MPIFNATLFCFIEDIAEYVGQYGARGHAPEKKANKKRGRVARRAFLSPAHKEQRRPQCQAANRFSSRVFVASSSFGK